MFGSSSLFLVVWSSCSFLMSDLVVCNCCYLEMGIFVMFFFFSIQENLWLEVPPCRSKLLLPSNYRLRQRSENDDEDDDR